MSQESVVEALRSDAKLVLISAPGGCGKTHEGARYAADAAATIGKGRVLILAHTHAACDAFSMRTRSVAARVEVRTLDSLIAEIADAYRGSIGLDVAPVVWVRGREDGFDELASRIAQLLRHHPMVARAVAQRFPVILCDEHQDSNADRHAVVMALHNAGAKLRVFGDTMQNIFGEDTRPAPHWGILRTAAERSEELDYPHRWDTGSPELGRWVLKARRTLEAGGAVSLRGKLPTGLEVVVAENAARRNLHYQPDDGAKARVREVAKKRGNLLILSHHNETVRSLRAWWGRQVPIWEGHTRHHLLNLVEGLSKSQRDPVAAGNAAIAFIQKVCTGFSDTAFATRLRDEIVSGGSRPTRGSVPAALQGLARRLLESPDHLGAAALLTDLDILRRGHAGFRAVQIDFNHEYWDAVRLGRYADPDEGLAEIIAARAHSPRPMPERVISTVHKAKGLQADHVLLLPCDETTFREKDRCLLYVALSRASHSLTLVVSRDRPSPLLEL